jgi:predicted acetyltransferase
MINNYRLIIPTAEYEASAFDYINEFRQHNSKINGTGGLDRYNDYHEWLLKLARDLDIANIRDGRVPANTYFFIRKSDKRIIGMINIRHKLNDFLFNEGGHIGYSIRPSERKKGYGTLLLSLGLQRCRELNINKVLIICDKSNLASAQVIKNNNGILENEIYSETCSKMIQRYWIKEVNDA